MITKKLVDETIELLQELVQNSCVNPPGNEAKSIASIKNFLEKKNVSCEVFTSAPNRQNLVAKIEGTGEGPSLMFGPSHVDVVPVASEAKWTYPPFSGEIADGAIWGRGTLDMLYIVVTQVQAFALLAQQQFKPKGDLILVIVADEEVGGKDGVLWLLENKPELMQADYAVSELGGIQLAENRFAFGVGEKGSVWLKLGFKGEPGHGSMPFGNTNAAVLASEAVRKLAAYSTPVSTKYIRQIAKAIGMNIFTRLLVSSKLLLPIALRALKGKNLALAKYLHAISRMTISPNIISSGVKSNVIPETAAVEVDVRTLPGQDKNYVLKHIKKAIGKKIAKEMTIETNLGEGINSVGNASPLDKKFIDAIEKVIQLEFPKGKFVPYISPGATDLRFLRPRGTISYGFSLVDPDISLGKVANLAHGTDERVTIRTVELSLKAFYHLAKELTG